MNLRKLLVLLLKIALAVAVLTWMVHTGKLNLSQVGAAFHQWPLMLAIVALVYLQIAIMSWRWNMLTNALEFGLRYREAFSLSLIGLLFTVVLPGSVSGDIMKAYYLGKRVPRQRAQAFTTIFMDRYLGLVSLLAIGGAGAALNFKLVSQNHILATLATFVAASLTGGVAILLIAVLMSRRISGWMRRLEGRVPLSGVLVRVWNSVETYRNRPSALFAALLVSLPAHLLACLGIYLAMRAVDAPAVPVECYLLFVPLGLITTALPLSPAGVGIGQAAFYTLFNILAPGAGASASNAFTVYQTLQLAVFLTGFVSYFMWSGVRSEAAGVAA